MTFINTILGIPLGYILYLAYQLTENFGVSILLFAIIIRIIIFPINILTHKNSICLLQIQPQLNRIKRRYAEDRGKLNEAQHNLFVREKYNPFIGMLPLFIQLFILLGVLQVMYHPMQHLLHLNQSEIVAYTKVVKDMPGYAPGAGEQLFIIEAIGLIDMQFLRINPGTIPSYINPSIELLIPCLSGISAFAYCMFQNLLSPGALSQSKKTNRVMTTVTVGFSVYFASVTPAGVGVYWTIANVLSIGVVLLLEWMYSPSKIAGEALAQIKMTREAEKNKKNREQGKKLKQREKKDVLRFNSANKELVYYALTSGQYRYFKTVIGYILENSDVIVHYLTNDPDDSVFLQDNDRLIPYYISQKKAISVLLKLDADIIVTTMLDLQTYHIKRSIVRDDIEYIYVPHGMLSVLLTASETGYDNYDTIFCVGPHQVKELRRREEIAGLPKKNLVKAGYGLYDQLIEQYRSASENTHQLTDKQKPQILIAPSWQDDNILDGCIEPILNNILGNGWLIIIRPHIQFTRICPEYIEELKKTYSKYADTGELVFDLEFSDNRSVFSSDILITDWSGVALDFSYCTLKPSIFINTPMKIANQNYDKYGLVAIDILLRDKVGVSVNIENIGKLQGTIEKLLKNTDSYKEEIQKIVDEYLYYPERSGEAGGRYILGQLHRAQKRD